MRSARYACYTPRKSPCRRAIGCVTGSDQLPVTARYALMWLWECMQQHKLYYLVQHTNTRSPMQVDKQPDDMGEYTSIRVTHELADELHKRKDRGDSYEDVIWQLIDEDGEDDE